MRIIAYAAKRYGKNIKVWFILIITGGIAVVCITGILMQAYTLRFGHNIIKNENSGTRSQSCPQLAYFGKSPLVNTLKEKLAEYKKLGDVPKKYNEAPYKERAIQDIRNPIWWWLPNGAPSSLDGSFPTYQYCVSDQMIGDKQFIITLRMWAVNKGIVCSIELDDLRLNNDFDITVSGIALSEYKRKYSETDDYEHAKTLWGVMGSITVRIVIDQSWPLSSEEEYKTASFNVVMSDSSIMLGLPVLSTGSVSVKEEEENKGGE